MEGIRFLISQPYVLHLRLDSVKTQSVSKRNEYIHGFTEYLVSLVLRHIFYCPAVMEPVCKLDQNNPHIIIESKEDPLEVFSLHALLFRLVLVVKNSLDLRKTVHERSYLLSEKALEIIYGIGGVFHDVMEKSSNYRLITQAYIAHNDLGYCYRMQDIWLPGTSSDSLVRLIGKVKGLLNHIQFESFRAPLACRFLQIRVFACNDFHVML